MFNDSLTDFLASERIRGFRRDAHRERLIVMAESFRRDRGSMFTRAHRGLMRLARKIKVSRSQAHGVPIPPSAGPARSGKGEGVHGSAAGLPRTRYG